MNRNKRFDFILVDLATLVYFFVLSILILIFGHKDWHYYILFNFLICGLVFLMAGWLSGKPSPVARFFRHWYPIILFTFIYEEIGGLIHLLFPGWFDSWINALEVRMLGIYPTVWLERFLCPTLNELMMFCYFSYYFLLPVLGFGLYLGRKIEQFDRLAFTVAVTFYVSYLGFIFFPVEGPRFNIPQFHTLKLEGPFFTKITQTIINTAGMHGGCMPSSHVAVALVVLVFSYRYRRTLFFILCPIILTLFVATVYGRFHYATDVVAGILVGIISILICDKINALWQRNRAGT